MAPSRARDHFTGSHYGALGQAGPFACLNPTVGYHPLRPARRRAPAAAPPEPERPPALAGGAAGPVEVYHAWRSRDNRKGRHALVVAPGPSGEGREGALPPPLTTGWAAVRRGLWRMVVRWPIWDVSFDVAVAFTLGSAVWVVNGFFVWLPLVAPSTEFPGENATAGGVSAFVGATVFELGSVLLMLEAVNENRADCFGWALEEALEKAVDGDGRDDGRPRIAVVKRHDEAEECSHSHHIRSSWLKGTRHPPLSSDGSRSEGREDNVGSDGEDGQEGQRQQQQQQQQRQPGRTWSWWPSAYELRTHYLHDVGFLACATQMMAATIFWISGFSGLPGIYQHLTSPGSRDGVYWTPQVLGGSGFVASSFLFMLEVQRRWYLPAPLVLGWHIGFWNFVGSVGFMLCGALGYAEADEACEWASAMATFVGSWAFLIGSLLQWYESLDKYPVTVEKDLVKLVTAEKEV